MRLISLLLLLCCAAAPVCLASEAAPRRLWEQRLVRAPAVAPLLEGDTLFVAGTDRRIACFDARTGDRRWRKATAGQVGCAIVRADSLLLLGLVSPASEIVAVECGNGRTRWSRRLESAPVGIVRSGGTVAVLEYGGATHGLDLRDGTERWVRKLKGPMAGMAIDGTSLRILARKDSLWSIDLSDGGRGWAVAVSGLHRSPPVVAAGRTLRITYDGEIVSHDGATGAEAARARAQAPQISPPAISPDGGCVTIAAGGEARAFHLPDLATAWSLATGETTGAGAIETGGTWIVACEGGRVLGLGAEDGSIAWTLTFRDPISSTPAVDGDLIAITDDGGRVSVYARGREP